MATRKSHVAREPKWLHRSGCGPQAWHRFRERRSAADVSGFARWADERIQRRRTSVLWRGLVRQIPAV